MIPSLVAIRTQRENKPLAGASDSERRRRASDAVSEPSRPWEQVSNITKIFLLERVRRR